MDRLFALLDRLWAEADDCQDWDSYECVLRRIMLVPRNVRRAYFLARR